MKITASKEKYAIIKAGKSVNGAFANVIDKNEITVVIAEKYVNKKYVIKSKKNYRLITFNEILPFKLVGFIAKVSKVLADAKIPIFVVSSYSTDHLLVSDKHFNKTLSILKDLK
jgi:uncharacterized protein